MRTVRGFFESVPRLPDYLAVGRAWGKVGFARQACSIEVKFIIDTACPKILILDRDFLLALTSLGIQLRGRLDMVDALRQLDQYPHLIERADPLKTVGGYATHLFHLPTVYLWLHEPACYRDMYLRHSPVACSTHDPPPRGAVEFTQVHGGFSTHFLETNGRQRYPSLLGREVLNRIRQLRWRGPASRITLSGV